MDPNQTYPETPIYVLKALANMCDLDKLSSLLPKLKYLTHLELYGIADQEFINVIGLALKQNAFFSNLLIACTSSSHLDLTPFLTLDLTSFCLMWWFREATFEIPKLPNPLKHLILNTTSFGNSRSFGPMICDVTQSLDLRIEEFNPSQIFTVNLPMYPVRFLKMDCSMLITSPLLRPDVFAYLQCINLTGIDETRKSGFTKQFLGMISSFSSLRSLNLSGKSIEMFEIFQLLAITKVKGAHSISLQKHHLSSIDCSLFMVRIQSTNPVLTNLHSKAKTNALALYKALTTAMERRAKLCVRILTFCRMFLHANNKNDERTKTIFRLVLAQLLRALVLPRDMKSRMLFFENKAKKEIWHPNVIISNELELDLFLCKAYSIDSVLYPVPLHLLKESERPQKQNNAKQNNNNNANDNKQKNNNNNTKDNKQNNNNNQNNITNQNNKQLRKQIELVNREQKKANAQLKKLEKAQKDLNKKAQKLSTTTTTTTTPSSTTTTNNPALPIPPTPQNPRNPSILSSSLDDLSIRFASSVNSTLFAPPQQAQPQPQPQTQTQPQTNLNLEGQPTRHTEPQPKIASPTPKLPQERPEIINIENEKEKEKETEKQKQIRRETMYSPSHLTSDESPNQVQGSNPAPDEPPPLIPFDDENDEEGEVVAPNKEQRPTLGQQIQQKQEQIEETIENHNNQHNNNDENQAEMEETNTNQNIETQQIQQQQDSKPIQNSGFAQFLNNKQGQKRKLVEVIDLADSDDDFNSNNNNNNNNNNNETDANKKQKTVETAQTSAMRAIYEQQQKSKQKDKEEVRDKIYNSQMNVFRQIQDADRNRVQHTNLNNTNNNSETNNNNHKDK